MRMSEWIAPAMVQTFAAEALYLLVHEGNARARAFYRRQGFVDTGRTLPYELEPAEREVEMRRAVAGMR